MGHLTPSKESPFWTALGLFLVSLVKRRFQRGGDEDLKWKPVVLRPGGKPLLKTGMLMNSVDAIVREVHSGGGTISIGTAIISGPVHQFGAVIMPKRAKALFIPLTRKGRTVGPLPAGMRTVTKTVKSGAEVTKPILKWGVDFVLKGSVTIPARPFLRYTPSDQEAVAAFIRRELPVALP